MFCSHERTVIYSEINYDNQMRDTRFSVCRAQFVARKRISLRIKASRRIIAGCNSCERTCAYVSLSSEVPIPRCSRETGRHVHPVFEQRSRDAARRISRSFTRVKNELPCENARADTEKSALDPEFQFGRNRYPRRTSSGKRGELREAIIRYLAVEFYLRVLCNEECSKRVRANK